MHTRLDIGLAVPEYLLGYHIWPINLSLASGIAKVFLKEYMVLCILWWSVRLIRFVSFVEGRPVPKEPRFEVIQQVFTSTPSCTASPWLTCSLFFVHLHQCARYSIQSSTCLKRRETRPVWASVASFIIILRTFKFRRVLKSIATSLYMTTILTLTLASFLKSSKASRVR
jgi:hypothetical protein